jgi:SAM-dependent methyltransferase
MGVPARDSGDVDEPASVFRDIYATDHWKGGSGEGSVADATADYRRVLETLTRSRSIRSVVDVGCGDWQFSRLVDWDTVRYTGIDIVPDLISSLERDFGSKRVIFIAADARTARLPKADLLVCKDVLQHWPNDAIVNFLSRELRRFRYALFTNDIASVHPHPGVNTDVPLGHWRPIDLEASPFDLRVRWRYDFDVRGEWTKRIALI